MPGPSFVFIIELQVPWDHSIIRFIFTSFQSAKNNNGLDTDQ